MPKRRRQKNMQVGSDKVTFRTLMIVSMVFVALPFLSVKFVPATDLPQHLAQIRILEEILNDPHQTTYSIDWHGANSLVYALVGVNWLIFDHIAAGKMTILEIALLWCFSIFLLARKGQRSTFSAVLASVCIYNVSLYWGFINFLIGWPVFVLWYLVVVDPGENRRPAWKEAFLICAISVLLFLAHVLWLLAAIAVLVVADLKQKLPFRRVRIHWLSLIPILLYIAMWYPKFIAVQKMYSPPNDMYWLTSPWDRTNLHQMVDIELAGLRGAIGSIVYGGVALWICASIATNWMHMRLKINADYLLTGALFLLFYLLAPDQHVNTILFAVRWLPIGIIFIILALPAPRIPAYCSLAAAMVFLALLSIATSIQWVRFENTENSGLEESLGKIQDNSRVLGLDFKRASDVLHGSPFFQTFAYAQVLHGGTLNFSFAEHHTGIVSFTDIERIRRKTRGLEWNPERVRFEDLEHFDYVLINGPEDIHRYSSSILKLKALTTQGSWRLYQCRNAAPSLDQNK
jgi:hypothetical protein